MKPNFPLRPPSYAVPTQSYDDLALMAEQGYDPKHSDDLGPARGVVFAAAVGLVWLFVLAVPFMWSCFRK